MIVCQHEDEPLQFTVIIEPTEVGDEHEKGIAEYLSDDAEQKLFQLIIDGFITTKGRALWNAMH